MRRILFLLSVIVLFSSCRTSADIQREKEMNDLRQELSRVQTNSADTGQNLDGVKDDLQKLKGALEKLEHNNKVDREDYLKTNSDLRQKISDLETKLDNTAKDLSESIESMKKDFQAAVKKIDEVSAGAESRDIKKKASTDDSKKMNLDARFKKARKLHNSKNYAEAEALYLSVAGAKSKWYDERAKFYLGSILFDQGKYKEAVIKLQEFIDAYPNSQFAPVALTIQAQSFIKLKKPKDAKIFYQDIISRYPNSKEAAEAKEKLKKL